MTTTAHTKATNFSTAASWAKDAGPGKRYANSLSTLAESGAPAYLQQHRFRPVHRLQSSNPSEVQSIYTDDLRQGCRGCAVFYPDHEMKHKKPFNQRHRTIKALIIYDDVGAATRAITVLRRASSLTKTRARWDIKPWRASVLGLPIAAEQALLEAVDADVIVLSDIPDAEQIRLMDWLKCWNALRNSAESALVVTRSSLDHKLAISRELSSFAAQNRLDLMIETDPAVGMDSATSELVTPKRESPGVPLSAQFALTPAASSNGSYRYWGINE